MNLYEFVIICVHYMPWGSIRHEFEQQIAAAPVVQYKMSDSEARKWKESKQLEALQQYRTMAREEELLPFPDVNSRDWKTYEMMVPEGEVVQIVKESDGWTKIKLARINVLGWVLSSSLSLTDPMLQPVQQPAEAVLAVSHASPGCVKHRKVTLSSFGLETLDHQLKNWCRQRGGGAYCSVPPSEVAAALRRAGIDSNLIFDARDFPDPNSWALCQLGHSGRHYKIVANLICHPNFAKWLKDVKKDFQDELEKTAGDISVAIYCRRGKHRSVAATVILRHILESEGYECEEWHLSNRRWCCKLNCDVCCNPPEDMKGHLDHAFNCWCSF